MNERMKVSTSECILYLLPLLASIATSLQIPHAKICFATTWFWNFSFDRIKEGTLK